MLDTLKTAGAGVRCSIFTLLLGALEAPLAACLGVKRVVVSVPVAGLSVVN